MRAALSRLVARSRSGDETRRCRSPASDLPRRPPRRSARAPGSPGSSTPTPCPARTAVGARRRSRRARAAPTGAGVTKPGTAPTSRLPERDRQTRPPELWRPTDRARCAADGGCPSSREGSEGPGFTAGGLRRFPVPTPLGARHVRGATSPHSRSSPSQAVEGPRQRENGCHINAADVADEAGRARPGHEVRWTAALGLRVHHVGDQRVEGVVADPSAHNGRTTRRRSWTSTAARSASVPRQRCSCSTSPRRSTVGAMSGTPHQRLPALMT